MHTADCQTKKTFAAEALREGLPYKYCSTILFPGERVNLTCLADLHCGGSRTRYAITHGPSGFEVRSAICCACDRQSALPASAISCLRDTGDVACRLSRWTLSNRITAYQTQAVFRMISERFAALGVTRRSLPVVALSAGGTPLNLLGCSERYSLIKLPRGREPLVYIRVKQCQSNLSGATLESATPRQNVRERYSTDFTDGVIYCDFESNEYNFSATRHSHQAKPRADKKLPGIAQVTLS